jgi:7-cyano-7-deazaguanine tRNA-ribosyltransferase
MQTIGRLLFKMIEYPRIWFSQIVGRKHTAPWKYFKVDGVLMNAYDFMQHPTILKEVSHDGIHRTLGFDGQIMMDSGGFLFMKKNIVDVTAKQIVSFYEETKPNYGVVLDHPILTTLSPNEIRKRQLETLKNTKIMLKHRTTKNPILIPVIHGHAPQDIQQYLRYLKKIGTFPICGIGSLVPSLYNVSGVGGILNVIRIIRQVRKQMPKTKLHVFGTGSALTMHLMFYAGADSLDTSSWRTKAAFGAIQMSGMGDRWVSKVSRKKPYPQLSKEEKKELENCKCPSCKKDGFYGLKISFSSRAIHNAWIYQKEVEKTRKLMKSNQYENYVQKIMKQTNFASLFSRLEKME